MRIFSNKVQCNNCKDVIESVHRHDYRTCTCRDVSVDGGKAYLKRVFKNEECFTELSEYKEEER